MAWFHGSLNTLENGKCNGKGILNTTTAILPNNFELPLFRVFDLQTLRIGGLLITGCPKWIVPD